MKHTIITVMLALIALVGHGQTTKTATIKGYSPALKDSTVAECLIDMVRVASDTVRDGHFTLTFPVEKLTECYFYLEGEGCPNFLKTIFVAPDAIVSMTGEDCLYPTWKVKSTLAEQKTANRISEYIRNAMNNMLLLDIAQTPYEKQDSAYAEMIRQTIEVLPSVPVDAVSIAELKDASLYARYNEGFPYMEQLKEVEKSVVARAPKGFEEELAYIHLLVYPPHVLQPGEEAVDAELYDMQGNTHHLTETFRDGCYVLLDFWSLGCGPCRMAEPEMREVYEQLKGKLEIVGISRDKLSAWQESDWSKKIVWKNWNDGKMGKGGIESRYCDNAAVPYYVLLSPDHHVVWKSSGYGPGMFLGMAAAINGPIQDNSKNIYLAVRKVETTDKETTVSFRYYNPNDSWFRIASGSCLTAGGRKYKLIAANGITLDSKICPTEKASAATEGILSALGYADFTLTFEPFETIPVTFDFKEGEGDRDFVIRNISLK